MNALLVAAAALGALVAAPAGAAPLLFTISGDFSASFTLDSNPVPDVSLGDGDGFLLELFGISGTYLGSAGTADILFYNGSSLPGGFEIANGSFDVLAFDPSGSSGSQIYSGSTAYPVFAPGTFELGMTGTIPGSNVTLTITDALVASGVPEPATWAMMIGGFGLIGGAMRFRRKVSVSFA